MVGQPERHLGNSRRKLLKLNAVEIININARNICHIKIEPGSAGQRLLLKQHLNLKLAKFAIGDNQKVATAARRIEKTHGSQLMMEHRKLAGVVPDCLKLAAQVVEKQAVIKRFGTG